MSYNYERLDVTVNNRLATVTIDNPPINLVTLELYRELLALSMELVEDLSAS